VVPIRDGAAGLEVLVAQRTPSARFMGGFWVFPGGRVEPTDPDDAHAAARELREETGVPVVPERLVPLDRWITPAVLPIRFDTAFFLGPVEGDPPVRIDGEEIVDARWAMPADLLAESAAGRATMAFPTLRQLEELEGWETVAAALEACRRREPPSTTPELELEGDEARLLIERGGVRRSYPAADVPAGERGPSGS
jgi:8-oxo-dGTP pyrophosphatase MutT (NUDIX family)